MATFIETAIQDLAKLCQEYKTLQKQLEVEKCLIGCNLKNQQEKIFEQAMKMCIGENWNKKCEACGKESGPAGLFKNGLLVCEVCEFCKK